MAGFFFNDEMTPQAIDAKRELIRALSKDNLSAAPVGHWTAALARVLGAGADQYETAKLNEADVKGSKDWVAAFTKSLGGAASPPAPSAGAALPASQPAPATIQSEPLAPPQPGPPMASDGTPMPPIRPRPPVGAPSWAGAMPSSIGGAPAIASALGNGQPVNVPPGAPPGTPQMAMNPTGQNGAQPSEQELVARTIAAEAGGKSQQEANAIAAVILNRAKSRKLSPADVVLERNQFEPWNGGPGGRNDPMSIDMNGPRGQQAIAALQAALGGQDPTGGATHFVGTAAQAALGRPMPAWSRQGDMRQQIGATTFYAPEGRVTGGAPVQMAQAGQPSQTDAGAAAPGAQQAQFNIPGAPAQSGSTPQAAALLQALSSPWAARNPMLAQLGQKVLGEQLSGNKLSYQTDGDGNIIALDPTGRRPPQVVYKAAVKPILRSEGQELVNPSSGQVLGGSGQPKISREIELRRNEAVKMGLDPNEGRTKQFILTGSYPKDPELTSTDKTAILEADETVSATKGAISALGKAKTLSKEALGYPGASLVARAGSIVGNTASEKTLEMNQVVTEQALSSLKSTFGGNPTEGERKILLDIQGSSSLPDSVRQKIFDRAIEAANRRLKFNEERAQQLRGGNFYKPAGNKQADAAPPQNAPVSIGGWKIEKVD